MRTIARVLILTGLVVVAVSSSAGFLPNEDWTQGAYFGTRGTYFADVTGDGKADAIVVNDDTVTVRRSDGSRFTPNEDWTHGPYFGSRGTYFADVTGDGWADAIVVNDDTVTVRHAAADCFIICGHFRFDPNEDWTHGPYFGTRGTYFADVTGDGRADAIVVNDDTVTVRRAAADCFISCSNFRFNPNEDWTHGPYFGTRGIYFADVTGDGKADAIVVNDDTVTVRRSDGSRFGPNEDWTGGPYFGTRGIYFADVTGDGKADAIVVNDDTVTVRRSDGSRFLPNEDWTGGAYFGSRGTFFADVTGDRRADSIVVNDDTVTVRRAEDPSPQRPLEVSRFTTSVLTNADADQILVDATSVLFQSDGGDDLSCQMRLFRNGNVTVFNNGNGVINTQQDFNSIVGLPGRVKAVNQINFCGALIPNVIGCSPTPGSSEVVVRFTANQEGILWAHEYGHTRGLNHRADTNAIMNPTIGTTRRRVNTAECASFRN